MMEDTMAGKVYVTGAAGMIGANIARALVTAGRAVVGIDNFWRGKPRNIADLSERGDFTFHHADILQIHPRPGREAPRRRCAENAAANGA